MKQALIKAALLIVSFSFIISCSPANTRSENAAAGAVTGAVVGGLAGSAVGAGTGQVVAIGAGVIAGALIGGYIGESWDHTDYVQTTYAFDHYPQHRSHHWKNKKTGAIYTVTPSAKHMRVHGNSHCRKYNMVAMVKGKKQTVHGVACRQADGSWKAVKA
jgi:surface antigen